MAADNDVDALLITRLDTYNFSTHKRFFFSLSHEMPMKQWQLSDVYLLTSHEPGRIYIASQHARRI